MYVRRPACSPSLLLVTTTVASLTTESLAASLTLTSEGSLLTGAAADIVGMALLLDLVESEVEGHFVALLKRISRNLVGMDKNVTLLGLDKAEALLLVEKLHGAVLLSHLCTR